MLDIEDLREDEDNKKLPGPDELGKLAERLTQEQVSGVRKLKLRDDTKQAQKDKLLARHRPIKGSTQADIEIYYSRLRAGQVEGELAGLYAKGELAALLYYGLYNHRAVSQHVTRQLSQKEQKKRAESYSQARALEALSELESAAEAEKMEPFAATWSIDEGPAPKLEAGKAGKKTTKKAPAKKKAKKKAAKKK